MDSTIVRHEDKGSVHMMRMECINLAQPAHHFVLVSKLNVGMAVQYVSESVSKTHREKSATEALQIGKMQW